MKIEHRSQTQKMVMVGVVASLLVVLSQISLPMPSGVPVTLQTFAIALCGYFLGPYLGLTSTMVYLAMGAFGIPVLAGFSGGFGFFLGVTGGFLWGFVPLTFLCGLGALRKGKVSALALGLAGLMCCHVLGVLQFAWTTNSPLWASALTVSLPYLIKDIASVVLAYVIAKVLLRSLQKARLITIQ